jgi:hypothetical protein
MVIKVTFVLILFYKGALQEWRASASCFSCLETTSSNFAGRVKISGFISSSSEIQNLISGAYHFSVHHVINHLIRII